MAVFLLRYWDIFLYWVSLYNFSMKLIYLSATAFTIFLILYKKPFCLVIILI
jgi:ER lumen protein retaining receptor